MIDVIRPDELVTVAVRVPEKAWHEACLWAQIAWDKQRRC